MAQKIFRDFKKPDVVSWIKHEKLPDTLTDTDMPTDAEVAFMIETAHSYYGKALIAFLYDTGCRISEAIIRQNV